MKNIFFVFLILVSPVAGQDTSEIKLSRWNSYIQLEAGFIFPSGDIKESIPIRHNVNTYLSENYSSGFINRITNGRFDLGIGYGNFYKY